MYNLKFTLVIFLLYYQAFAQDPLSSPVSKDGVISGFTLVEPTSIPGDVFKNLVKLEKKFRYDKDYSDDTLKYYGTKSGYWGLRFISQYYEMTFVVADSKGKWMETVSSINPEFEEFNHINDSVTERGYYIDLTDSPASSVYRRTTSSDKWFEARVMKEGTEDNAVIMVFDKKYKFIRAEDAR
jgi:hypothetical protein